MAYNTKAIKLDVNQKPIPQFYNPVADEYEVLQGVNGATRHVLYGADGNPISTTGNKLAVRATETETLLESLDDKDFATQTTLAAVLAKLSADPATQTTLAAILEKIIAAPSTEAKQDTLIGHVDGVESALATLLTQLDTTGIKKIIDTVVVQVAGNTMEKHGLLLNRPAANSVPDGFLYFAVDAESIDDKLCYARGNGWEVVE